jgi:recombination protein RecT
MALKTVLKRLLKTAPMKTEFRKAISMDESIKTELSVDMSEVRNEDIEYINVPYQEGDASN